METTDILSQQLDARCPKYPSLNGFAYLSHEDITPFLRFPITILVDPDKRCYRCVLSTDPDVVEESCRRNAVVVDTELGAETISELNRVARHEWMASRRTNKVAFAVIMGTTVALQRLQNAETALDLAI